MPNINDAFPSAYLKASDIQGATPIVTIDHVAFEAVGRERLMKAVVYFKGKDKGVVLNKTNATKIAQIAGSQQTEDWTGTRIMLYATETEFGGETVECIRIKPVPANRQAVAPVPANRQAVAPVPQPVPEPETGGMVTDDDIPF